MSASETNRTSHVLVVSAGLAMLPAVVLAAASFWWTAEATRGGGLWEPVTLTLAEAAAAGDLGDIAQLIGTGEDPNRPAAVRPGLLGDQPAAMTPLEAAARGGQVEAFALLVRRGAVATSGEMAVLRCAEREEPNAEIKAMLDQLDGPVASTCDTALTPK
jgi:hypothetical protein